MQTPMSHKYRSPNELCMDSRQNVPILNKFLQYGIAIYIRDEDQYRSGSAFQTNQCFCLMNQSLRILYAKSTFIRNHQIYASFENTNVAVDVNLCQGT